MFVVQGGHVGVEGQTGQVMAHRTIDLLPPYIISNVGGDGALAGDKKSKLQLRLSINDIRTRDTLVRASDLTYPVNSLTEHLYIMAGKKGENSKKAAGNARKADAAAKKNAAEDAKREAVEDEKWQKGSKSNAKK